IEILAGLPRHHPDRRGEVIAGDQAGALGAREHAVDPRPGIEIARSGMTLEDLRGARPRVVDDLGRLAGGLDVRDERAKELRELAALPRTELEQRRVTAADRLERV